MQGPLVKNPHAVFIEQTIGQCLRFQLSIEQFAILSGLQHDVQALPIIAHLTQLAVRGLIMATFARALLQYNAAGTPFRLATGQ